MSRSSIKRFLDMKLPKKQSAFLWGARQTGKSTFLKLSYPKSVYFDFLQSSQFVLFKKEPYRFREAVEQLSKAELQHPIIVDEIQLVPELLSEIHWLIENTEAYFILCGSSARKLRQGGVHLLGGRAWRYEFFPLVYAEIPKFDLLRTLNHGMIPSHYLSDHPEKALKAYTLDYLAQEIKAEGLARNLADFARFLDAVAFSHGEIINYTKIAEDSWIDKKTVKEYYQILVDTLFGYFVPPYRKRIGRSIIRETPKFYLFDVGVANQIAKNSITSLEGINAGRPFEHYIFLEIRAYLGLKDKDIPIQFWRTVKEKHEVDFILGDGEIAIETKISNRIRPERLKGLTVFTQEYKPKRSIVVCNESHPRQVNKGNGVVIEILPYKTFLEALWAGEIV